MAPISSADLLLNRDGSTYHLNLLPQHVSEHIIAVGDPSRVYNVSRYFDRIEFEMNRREFITHVGRYNNKRITVVSTGIGTDNVEIFLTELDALVNIDLKSREFRPRKRKLKIIRIGTTGALQEDIPLGSLIATDYAVGLDNLMSFYDLKMTPFEEGIATDIQQASGLEFRPYVVRGSGALLRQIGKDMIIGNTVTAPGFYAPQGRKLRIPIRYPEFLKLLMRYHDKDANFWLTNFEMETAGYYALSRLLGHEVVSLSAVLVNRITNRVARSPEKIIDGLIKNVLDAL